MSNPTNDNNVTTLPDPAEETPSQEEKPNFVAKTKAFVKNHKKSTIAVGALVGLVGLAAVTGKKQPLPGAEVHLELEPPHASLDVDVVTEDDTESA